MKALQKRFWTNINRFKQAAKCLHVATGLKRSQALELLARIYGFRDYFEARDRLLEEHPLSDVDYPPSQETEAFRISKARALLHTAGVSLPRRPGQLEPEYLALFAPIGEMKRRLGMTRAVEEDAQHVA